MEEKKKELGKKQFSKLRIITVLFRYSSWLPNMNCVRNQDNESKYLSKCSVLDPNSYSNILILQQPSLNYFLNAFNFKVYLNRNKVQYTFSESYYWLQSISAFCYVYFLLINIQCVEDGCRYKYHDCFITQVSLSQ